VDLWGEPIPGVDEYIDATFGEGGYLARKWGAGYTPRGGQIALSRSVDAAIRARTHLLSEAPTGCHAAGQLVMVVGADGEWTKKRVEDVVVGDRLAHWETVVRAEDHKTVLGLARGEDAMVDVVPTAPGWRRWRVNRGHILTLIEGAPPIEDARVIDVPLVEWLEWPAHRRAEYQLLRVGHGSVMASRSAFELYSTGTTEPYYGFTLDGDGRFLLGDFTVTHNTGKSLAYSVPATYHAAVHARTVVIVTANIALQEQLFLKDLPLLAEILPWSFTFGLMKGRGNYLCRSQFEKQRLSDRQQPMFSDERSIPANERDRVRLVQWAEHEISTHGFGDQSALGWKPADKLWRDFSVAPEECRGQRCAFKETCGALAAQRKARQSQVIVTNYHVLFIHLRLWMERGIDAVLPPFDVVICDEAQKCSDTARDFFGWRYGEGSFKKLARHVRGTQPLVAEGLERAAGWFFQQMLDLRRDRDRYKARVVPSRLNGHDVQAGEQLLERLGEFSAAVDQELAGLETLGSSAEAGERSHGAEQARDRAVKLSVAVRSLLEGTSDDEVIFLEEDEFRAAHVACRLVRPGGVLHHALFGKTVRRSIEDGATEPDESWPVSVVCTSATLATESGFGFARSELGVSDCAELVVESPFDYPNQALLILPEVCDPNDALFTSECAAILLRTIVLARGRTLGLFTSRKRMNDVYDLIAGKTPYRILKQDDGQRTQLVEEFRRDTHSVLLGVSSFWAGVDVPGESLSVVWIDKIPFPSPDDPVVERLTETDRSAWFTYAVPRAIIEFKQGFGRLIRSATDRGVVVCCDKRLQTKRYGKQFLRAMPSGMQKIKNLESIREWLDGPEAFEVPPAPPPPPFEEIDPLS
jgi:ATP-dependent DNA helicase DinG